MTWTVGSAILSMPDVFTCGVGAFSRGDLAGFFGCGDICLEVFRAGTEYGGVEGRFSAWGFGFLAGCFLRL